jgi:hypothetical protein
VFANAETTLHRSKGKKSYREKARHALRITQGKTHGETHEQSDVNKDDIVAS